METRDFNQALRDGQYWEGQVAGYYQEEGYEATFNRDNRNSYGSPCLESGAIAPDITLVNIDGVKSYVEVKSFSAWIWLGIKHEWRVSVTKRKMDQYALTNKEYPVSVCFIVWNNEPSQTSRKYKCPKKCPSGVWITSIKQLDKIAIADWDSQGRECYYFRARDLKPYFDQALTDFIIN